MTLGEANSTPTLPSEKAPERQVTKRMPAGSIRLQFAGDLILAARPAKEYLGLFRRYESLLELFANQEIKERVINYKLLNALMITSHAKKMANSEERRRLFDLKNHIFLDLTNNLESRKKIGLKYLISSHFRVVNFCENCAAANSTNETPRHKWKFCDKCQVDRNFYNIMALQHKFDSGSATIFLSNDHVSKVKNPGIHTKGRREDFEEEAVFKNYRYTIRNLDAIDLESVLKMHDRLMNRK
jgi:hypothetical protein